MIKDLVFDFGGVLVEIDTHKAKREFAALGLENPDEYLNSYRQTGAFFALENGDITGDDFIKELSLLCGRNITPQQAHAAWMGFVVKVNTEYLDFLQQLRPHYRLSVLSNTNPFLQSWARSKEFTPQGKSLDDYFDNLFLSYKMNCSKPGDDIYLKMLSDGRMKPEETLFIDDGEKNIETASRLGINVLHVRNGEDWRPLLKNILSNDKQI